MIKIVINDSTGTIDVVFWRNHSKIVSTFRVGEEVRITYLKMKYYEYTKSMGSSNTKKSDNSGVSRNPNLIKSSLKFTKKDTSLRGKVTTLPIVDHLRPSSPVDTIFSFTIKDK